MSTKEWISSHRDGTSLYQECLYDSEKHEINPNSAVIQIDNPKNFSILRTEFVDEMPFTQLVVEIPAVRFDQIAIDWCKKRQLSNEAFRLEAYSFESKSLKIKGAAKGILSHIKVDQNINNEDSLMNVIEQALKDIIITDELIDLNQE